MTHTFPNAPDGWSPDDAKALAAELDIELTDDHWSVVQALQEYFAKHDIPNRRELTDALEERFHVIGGLKRLYILFPNGPIAQGCQLAGLEVPAGNIDKSFGSVV